MREKTLVVGVVGAAGDLGRQVTRLLISHGFLVAENDKTLKASVSINELLEKCDIIHFCIPAAAVPGNIKDTKALVILHDSVMSSSIEASQRRFSGKAIPAHMLMNKQAMVIVGKGLNRSSEAARHFEQLGQVTSKLTVADHDKLIARSQAPLLLMIEVLLKDLRSWNKKGLLTPSAVDLLQSLESRQANWTPATRASILKNTQIDKFVEDLRRVKR